MAGFPDPITNENFPAAWSTVCRKYKHAKVKAAIRKIAKPIAELLFFPAFLMLAFGASVTYTTPNVSALIRRSPVVPGLWQQLETVLFGSADTVLDHILRSALFLYAIPFAAFLITALIILLVYHPKTYGVSGDVYRDGQALWTMARHAATDSRVKGKDVGGTLALIAGIIEALGALAVIFYWLLVPGGEDVLAGIGVTNTLKLFGLALVLIFSYALVALPLELMMKLICACPVSRKISQRAEDYCRGLRRGPAVDMPPVIVPTATAPAVPVGAPTEAPEEASAEAPEEAAPAEAPEEAPAEEAPEAPAETASE